MPLNDFPERFASLFPHRLGQRILVALSGGADSVALLELLLDPGLALTLEAAHVHHQVRGDEADRDAAFCRRLCSRLGVPFHLVRLEADRPTPEGREASWRRRRYEALLALAESRRLDAVATGHHRDDVAEGVLLQLLRGSGPRAMAGIAAEAANGVIRPLLAYRRAELQDWLVSRGESWCDDSSNRDLTHLRNRVRHQVLPALRSAAPRIDDHLVALAHRLADDESFLSEELARRGQWIAPWHPDGGVPVAAIRSLPKALRGRWLHGQADRVGIGRVSARQLELLEALLDEGGPRAVALAGRWRLRSAKGRLWLEPPRPPAPYALHLEPGTTLDLPVPGWRIRVGAEQAAATPPGWRWKADRGAALTVRSPRPEDVISEPDGRQRRVSRLIAWRAPRHLRPAWPVICQNDTITWVPGIWRSAERGDLVLEVVADGRAADHIHR
jgi:tRNA(Ile)-lysidine synthase